MSVDDVRRKAYGNLDDDIVADIEGYTTRVEKHEEKIPDEDNLLVDLSRDDEKPSVSEITMGDAEEYFRDLGLEYNIDYKDSSKEKATGRRVTEDYDEKEKVTSSAKTEEVAPASAVTNSTSSRDDASPASSATDDNLFDLIDSMYEEEEEKE